MKKTTWWGSAIAGLALLGCGTADPGSSGADLAYVDESSLESRGDLYIDPSISWRPGTLEQLGTDATRAIPVEVEIFDGVAVAWMRHDGVLLDSRTRADIVSLYRVYERATVISDEIVRDEGAPVVYTPGTGVVGSLDSRYEGSQAGAEPNLYVELELVLIDWFDRSRIPGQDDVELWRELEDSHPGCLEE